MYVKNVKTPQIIILYIVSSYYYFLCGIHWVFLDPLIMKKRAQFWEGRVEGGGERTLLNRVHKVMEFYNFIFMAWKVIEFNCRSLKVMEN